MVYLIKHRYIVFISILIGQESLLSCPIKRLGCLIEKLHFSINNHTIEKIAKLFFLYWDSF